VQKSLDTIEVRLVASREMKKDEEDFFIDEMQKHWEYPMNIEIKYLDAIPRSKGGKFEDFMSEVL
jgi:phenylacetate-CoA ligase